MNWLTFFVEKRVKKREKGWRKVTFATRHRPAGRQLPDCGGLYPAYNVYLCERRQRQYVRGLEYACVSALVAGAAAHSGMNVWEVGRDVR